MFEYKTPGSGFLGHLPTPYTVGYPWGDGVVFSKDSGQLRFGSASAYNRTVDIIEDIEYSGVLNMCKLLNLGRLSL